MLAVLKVYSFVDGAQRRDCLLNLAADTLGALPRAAYIYSVNFGPARKFDLGKLADSIARFDDVEHFSIMSPDGEHGVHATALVSLQLPQRLYEFCLFSSTKEPQDWFVGAARRALKYGRPIYGYGRILPVGAAPLSEGLPKNSLFGKTHKVDPQVHVWKQDPTLSSALKGVYPFNIVSKDVLGGPLLGPLVARLGLRSTNVSDGGLVILTLDKEELAAVRATADDFRDFVRF